MLWVRSFVIFITLEIKVLMTYNHIEGLILVTFNKISMSDQFFQIEG